MRSPKNPQAFSRPASFCPDEHLPDAVEQDGMTLLDYFAGQAVGNVIDVVAHLEGPIDDEDSLIAKKVYGIAKAMLKERDRGLQ